MKDGKVVETTASNIGNTMYYGLPLSKSEAAAFVNWTAAHPPGGGVVRRVPPAKKATKERIVIHVGVKGGPSSGNWGHAGRPGKLGGSLPRGTAMSIATGRDWQQRQTLKIVMAKRVFPTDGFASSQAAQDWASKAYPETQFDLAAGGHTVVTPTLKTYNDLAQKYPEVAKHVTHIGLGKTAPDAVVTASRDGSRIVMNSDWFSKQTGAELREATRDAVKAGFYPAGAGVGHYMAHAYGVQVMNWLGTNPAANASVVSWLNQNFGRAKSVSIFATTGKTEFFGELFGALHGGKATNPLVGEFGQLLSNAMQIKRGAKELGEKGSAASGNHGHAGRPGKIGGSVVKGGSGAGDVESNFQQLQDMYMKVRDERLHKAGKQWSELEGSYFGTTLSLSVNNDLRRGFADQDSVAGRCVADFQLTAIKAPVDVTTYRAVRHGSLGNLQTGDIIQDKGFVSTTMSQKYAMKFNPENVSNNGWVGAKRAKTDVAEIRVHKGTKIAVSEDKSEYEVLLAPGSKFKVISTTPLVLETVGD